jgi:hypothetical protein
MEIADSDEAGHAFQSEAGHLFRSEAGRGSDLMSATLRRAGDIPPCIRQRPFGIAADRQGLPFLVRAPHRRLRCMFGRGNDFAKKLLTASMARTPSN